MSLFPRFSHYHPTSTTSSDINPLLRLLSDYDLPTTATSASTIRSFAPKFDVREGKEAYYLDGELPGINQNEIDIEFTDPQTMVVKGRVEREYASGDKPGEAEGGDKKGKKQATVEEEGTAEGGAAGKEVSKGGEKGVTKAEGRHDYWVSERSVGEFHRTFSFPSRVDSENVKARLKNGILSVTVPKVMVGKGAKRIAIE